MDIEELKRRYPAPLIDSEVMPDEFRFIDADGEETETVYTREDYEGRFAVWKHHGGKFHVQFVRIEVAYYSDGNLSNA